MVMIGHHPPHHTPPITIGDIAIAAQRPDGPLWVMCDSCVMADGLAHHRILTRRFSHMNDR